MPEKLTIQHEIKTINSPVEAGAYGFAEGLGKGIGWGLAILLAIFAIKNIPISTPEMNPPVEAREQNRADD